MRSRPAMTLLETVAAVSVMSVILTLTLQAIAMGHRQERAYRHRLAATLEADNIMQHVSALPWEKLQTDLIQIPELQARAQEVIPKAKVSIDIESQDTLKRIHVEVRWNQSAGKPGEKIRLTTWLAEPINVEDGDAKSE